MTSIRDSLIYISGRRGVVGSVVLRISPPPPQLDRLSLAILKPFHLRGFLPASLVLSSRLTQEGGGRREGRVRLGVGWGGGWHGAVLQRMQGPQERQHSVVSRRPCSDDRARGVVPGPRQGSDGSSQRCTVLNSSLLVGLKQDWAPGPACC